MFINDIAMLDAKNLPQMIPHGLAKSNPDLFYLNMAKLPFHARAPPPRPGATHYYNESSAPPTASPNSDLEKLLQEAMAKQEKHFKERLEQVARSTKLRS